MGDNKYDPEVNKRLELVRKQFQRNAAEEKKQKAVESRQKYFDYIVQNKVKIGRIITYTFLAVLVLAVIGVVISVSLSS